MTHKFKYTASLAIGVLAAAHFVYASEAVGETTEQPATNEASSLQPAEAEQSNWSSRDVAIIVTPILSLLGVGLIVYFTRRNVLSEQWLKTNRAEADYLQNKLDSFYGPLILLSQSNHHLAQDLRSRQVDPGSYRLLDKLFDNNWRDNLTPGDATFVDDICHQAQVLSKIMEDHVGLVDQQVLEYLARAHAHFKVLRLAHEKKLGVDSKPYLKYVYPRQLDEVLSRERARLQARIELLRRRPTEDHGEIGPIDLNGLGLKKWPDPNRPDLIDGELQRREGSGESINRSESTSPGSSPER
ncbi:MAG: hypothetical protein AAF797_08495 [Planctomycetota bacterium]